MNYTYDYIQNTMAAFIVGINLSIRPEYVFEFYIERSYALKRIILSIHLRDTPATNVVLSDYKFDINHRKDDLKNLSDILNEFETNRLKIQMTDNQAYILQVNETSLDKEKFEETIICKFEK